MTKSNHVAVQFSGGRDSTLTVCEYVQHGMKVHALRFQTGLGINADLADFRVKELGSLYGNRILFPGRIPCHGLVREIATRNVERDFQRYDGKNLILLGEKLAIHAYAVAYCRELGIPIVADGVSGYQSEFPEQRPAVVAAVRNWTQTYEVAYETPRIDVSSVSDAVGSLARLGLSPKAVEGLSMFADSSTRAADETCLAYVKEKIPIMSSLIEAGIPFKYMKAIVGSLPDDIFS